MKRGDAQMLSARQRRIIEALQKEQGALTGTELAKLLAVSSRTVRTDIRSMEAELAAEGARIASDTRRGCRLEPVDAAQEARFQAFVRSFSASSSPSRTPSTPIPCARPSPC